jgi:hypothetical protein
MAGQKARSAVFAPDAPAIPIERARPRVPKRDARDKRGHDGENVARMKRSEIRERHITRIIPDYASLHPGYAGYAGLCALSGDAPVERPGVRASMSSVRWLRLDSQSSVALPKEEHAMTDRKRIREIVGYTRAKLNKSPAAWLRLAQSYHTAATLLHNQVRHDSRPFVMNAGYSLEQIIKCLLTQQGLEIPEGGGGHDLPALSRSTKVKLTSHQLATLEEFTEIIVWAGRYPAPTKEGRWNNYQDIIFEKHVIRERRTEGAKITAVTRADPATFPSWENYLRIWDKCFAMVDPKLKTLGTNPS